MRIKNKLLKLATVSSLLLAGLSNVAVAGAQENFNETGLPIVNEPIEIHIAGPYDSRTGTDYNNLETFATMNEGTNINPVWELTPSSDWADKRSLMVASVSGGDLPDVMLIMAPEQVVAGGEQGYFIQLTDLIEQYMPNFSQFLAENPEVRETITAPDGHIYSIPYADMSEYKHVDGNSLWINEEWLAQLGLEMPETTEEFKTALEAFRDNDMNGNGDATDEIPLVTLDGNGDESIAYLFGSFNTLHEPFIVRDGVVEYTKTTEEYKNAIKYIASLYQEGLIDQEMFTMESADLISKISAGETPNVGAFFAWSSDRITNTDFQDQYGSPVLALEGPEGHRIRGFMNAQIQPGALVVTSNNENSEATLRWVDQAFEYEMSFALRQGPNRAVLNDEGIYKITEPEDGMTAGEWRVKETPYNNFVYGFTQEMREQMDLSNLKPGLLDPDKDEWYEISQPYLVDWIYPRLLFTPEQYDQISMFETDIDTYVSQMTASWVTGASNIDEDWDNYVSTLEQMGLNEYTQIHIDAYNNHLENTAATSETEEESEATEESAETTEE